MLAEDLSHPIADITFAPSEMTPINSNDKLTRLDVACTLDSGEQVDVEVQVVNYKDMQRRTLYYWSQLYLTGLSIGHPYKELKPVIAINILKFSLFADEEPHSMWSVYNSKTQERLNKDLTLHFLEVPKFASIAKKPISKMSRMERWLAYFANKLDAKGKEELIMSEAAIRDAVDAAKVFFNNDAERLQYINREMAIHDYESNIAGAREDGEKDMVVKMLKSGLLSTEQIAQISGFPLTEVQKLVAGKPA